jgi:hypothetical protein
MDGGLQIKLLRSFVYELCVFSGYQNVVFYVVFQEVCPSILASRVTTPCKNFRCVG